MCLNHILNEFPNLEELQSIKDLCKKTLSNKLKNRHYFAQFLTHKNMLILI